MEDKKEYKDVPFYVHEAVCEKIERVGKESLDMLEKTSNEALSKMDRSNKRMLSALIAVCVTLLIVVFGFLSAYKSMTSSWVGFIDKHFNEVVEEGVDDGLFLQGDSEDNPSTFEK